MNRVRPATGASAVERDVDAVAGLRRSGEVRERGERVTGVAGLDPGLAVRRPVRVHRERARGRGAVVERAGSVVEGVAAREAREGDARLRGRRRVDLEGRGDRRDVADAIGAGEREVVARSVRSAERAVTRGCLGAEAAAGPVGERRGGNCENRGGHTRSGSVGDVVDMTDDEVRRRDERRRACRSGRDAVHGERAAGRRGVVEQERQRVVAGVTA